MDGNFIISNSTVTLGSNTTVTGTNPFLNNYILGQFNADNSIILLSAYSSLILNNCSYASNSLFLIQTQNEKQGSVAIVTGDASCSGFLNNTKLDSNCVISKAVYVIVEVFT